MPARGVYGSTVAMNISSELNRNIRNVYGEAGAQWLSQLPKMLKELCTIWDVELISPLPFLTYNFVAEVESRETQKRHILKIGPPTATLEAESRWLRLFPTACPEVFKYDNEFNAFLMEKLSPGKTLKTLVDLNRDDEATRALARTILKLQETLVRSKDYKPLIDLLPDLNSLDGVGEPYLLEMAKDLYQDLCQNADNVLLHGDLHHDNIISKNDDWKVIDPHGYTGDRVSEVGVLMYNPLDRVEKITPLKVSLERRLKILSEELPFDPQRMKAWAFCMTMLSAAWDHQDSRRLSEYQIELARTLNDIKI